MFSLSGFHMAFPPEPGEPAPSEGRLSRAPHILSSTVLLVLKSLQRRDRPCWDQSRGSEAADTGYAVRAERLSALVFEPSVRLRDFGRSGVTMWLKSVL